MCWSVLSRKVGSVLWFYEGYWGFPGAKLLIKFGKNFHWTTLRRLAQRKNDQEAYWEIYHFYPMPEYGVEKVMPTRLGNILKNAELYPHERYNIDSVLVWPRLY